MDNLRKLVGCFLTKDEEITDIFYYTSRAHWDQEKVSRHIIFINAQEHFGVRVIQGHLR